MKTLRYFMLAMLVCSAQALFSCEPWIAVLDSTFGNAVQANADGITKFSAGVSVYLPVEDGVMLQGVYDNVTGHIISIAGRSPTSFLMVTDSDGVITTTVAYKFNETDTLFTDIGLLTDSTTVVIGGNSDGENVTPTLLFFDQEGALLNSNTQAFSDIIDDYKPMKALAVVSTNTIVMVGTIQSEFAIAFYNYDGVLTKTVLTTFNTQINAVADVGLLSDNNIAVIGDSGNSFAFATYGLDGSLTNSIVYPITDVVSSAGDGKIFSLVPSSSGTFFVSGVVTDGSSSPATMIPFLAKLSNDLQTFQVLRLLEEQAVDTPLQLIPYVNLSDAGNGSVLMSIVSSIPSKAIILSTLVKLTDEGDYDLAFGPCNGAQVFPPITICREQECLMNTYPVAFNSLVQLDGKILLFGAITQRGSDGTSLANFRITGASVPPFNDPLTAAIQRKYFGITA